MDNASPSCFSSRTPNKHPEIIPNPFNYPFCLTHKHISPSQTQGFCDTPVPAHRVPTPATLLCPCYTRYQCPVSPSQCPLPSPIASMPVAIICLVQPLTLTGTSSVPITDTPMAPVKAILPMGYCHSLRQPACGSARFQTSCRTLYHLYINPPNPHQDQYPFTILPLPNANMLCPPMLTVKSF